jgi:outer membrane immunogenic protein
MVGVVALIEHEWSVPMRKKGLLVATSAGFAAAVVPGAQAADMPIKAPRYVEPAANWEGWYVGVHAGAAWQQTQTATDEFGDFFGASSFSKTGFIGGGQIGYNWQHGNFVFGLEGDISGLSGKNSGTPGFNFDSYTSLQSQIRWLSTVRGRFGLAVGDTMAYATAGVAIGGVKNTVNLFGNTPYSSSKTKAGWTVGGGIEHMLSRNWTIGLEGLFVDLGKTSVSSGFNLAKTTKFSNQAIIGRVKLNYKF